MRIKTSCPAFLFILFTSFLATAQHHELIGRIALADGNSFSYKLSFSDSAGIITGYSISDAGGPNQTKASITGTINTEKKTFTFTEKKVLNAKDKTTEYCLLKCNCKVIEQKGLQLFNGKARGYINGDAKRPCGKGTVLFSTAEDILKFTQQLVNTADTTKLNTEQRKALDSLKKQTSGVSINTIDSKKGASFGWATDTLKIELFDDGEVDNDRITVFLDGKNVLDNWVVNKEKHELNLQLPPGAHTVKFHAENEGNNPPNTFKAFLWDGKIRHTISTYLNYNEDATVEISK